jgi:hypothetical protein
MKNLFLVAISLGVLAVSSCKKDDEVGTVTLHFKATYDGLPLKTFETLPFENGEQLQFTHMSYYVTDLELTDQTSTELLDDVELINLSFDNLTAADGGYTLTISDVPAGTYDGIQFGVGVPADINQKKPADFPSSNPLSNTGYYWIPWNSYIFMKTEGRLDTLGNGALDLGFALHTGSDPLYRILEGSVPLTVEDGKTTNLDIVLDYKKLLEGIDIKTSPQNHNPEDIAIIQAMVDNLASAFSLVQ